ncbi:MAG: HEAT repeat domain-containing protein [Chloroflexi bacterium]|nr:HEAT repeat domain-containing protein [Chloroflexota bacterium]
MQRFSPPTPCLCALSVPRLADLIRQADPGTRYLAAKALGQIGDEAEAAAPTLLDEARAIMGDLLEPNHGVAFVVPLDEAIGVRQPENGGG